MRAVLPVAIAVPLLGLAGDVIDPWLAIGVLGLPSELASILIWLAWGLIVPLLLALERRFPVRQHVFIHLAALLPIVAAHTGVALIVNAKLVERMTPQELTYFIWIDLVPRYFGVDLLICALVLAAGHALRSHVLLRERERAAAELDADVRRAELDLVRTHIDRDHVLGELARIRDDIGRDTAGAEQRIESLSDYFERQLAAMQLSETAAREPLAEVARERRILGLTPMTWLALLLAPLAVRTATAGVSVAASLADGTFDAARFARTIQHTFYGAACIPIVVVATLPHGRTARLRIAHSALMLLLCFVLSFVPDLLVVRDLGLVLGGGSRTVIINRSSSSASPPPYLRRSTHAGRASASSTPRACRPASPMRNCARCTCSCIRTFCSTRSTRSPDCSRMSRRRRG